jgi:peptide/nickel transport system substrate-binding protein
MEERMRLRNVTTAIASALTLILLSASPGAAAKDSITVAFSTKFATLDCYQTNQRANINIGYLLFDPLLERDPDDGSLHPHLVTSWKTLGPTIWEFKLRSGVTFHNGNPLNAESVRFTIEDRILDPAQKSPLKVQFKWIDRVEVVDELTFRIHTAAPFPLVLQKLNTVFIYDPAYTKEKGDQHVAEHPMGSGPYKFVEWKKSDRVVMTANENYWKQGVPGIKNATVRIIPEISTRLAELMAGGIDVALDMTPDQMGTVKSNPKVTMYSFPVLRPNFWQFDAMGRAGENPVNDVRVRRAIWHAIDRQAIITHILKGMAAPINAPGDPHHWAYDHTIKGYDYNPEKAKQLLKEAGYPDGFEIDLWQYVESQNIPNQAAMDYLSKVGIKVNLKDYRGNVGQMVKIIFAGKITGIGNYQWGSYNIFDMDAILTPHFDIDAPRNYCGDKELSQWLDEARSTLDEKKRKENYKKAQQRIIDQVYWMPFFSLHMIHGHSSALKYKAGVDQVPRIQYADWTE